MKRVRNLLFILLTSLVVIAVIIYLDLIVYGLNQGLGQLKIIRNVIPVEQILSSPDYPDSLQDRIQFIQEVKEYAEGIGLAETKNYSTFYDQGGKPILWNLSASEPFKFESVEWSFPVIGTFGYKGFFDLQKAKEEEAELISKGFDTRVRVVGAWSTLGWFKDPILSNFLRRSHGQIAETIFHELTHGTIFFKDSLQFNENLASFIGEQAAQEFLTYKFGPGSAELQGYLDQLHDERLYRECIFRGRDRLDSLYSTFDERSDTVQMKKMKEAVIEEIIQSTDSVSFRNTAYRQLLARIQPNNAYFMAFQRYHSNRDEMLEIFNVHGNSLSAFISYFEELD